LEGGLLSRALRTVLADSIAGAVVRALSPHLPRAPLSYVRAALDRVHLPPDADGFARALGWSRPHLSRRLHAAGLPSTGHLLMWSRLLHAGAWLSDPGRSGESVSRQLGYANGSTFRRALRNFIGLRPSAVGAGGGLTVVLDAFMEASPFPHRFAGSRRVA
jgi:AraC-like DNA-binding protein